jgi:hypothetical protein
MKTEITLNDKLAAKVEEVAKASHLSFNQALEQAVNAGLPFLVRPAIAEPFHVQPHDFGISLDDPKAALAAMDEEDDLRKIRGVE